MNVKNRVHHFVPLRAGAWDNQAACTAEPQSGVPADYSETEFLPDRNDVLLFPQLYPNSYTLQNFA